MSNKVGKVLNYIYDKALIIFAIFLLLFSVYILLDTHYVRTVSAGNSFYVYKPTDEDINSYMNLSDECIGWITIDDSSIDYPLMYTKNDTKYLNTAPDGSYSIAGSIFLHWKNNPELTDPFNLIHGHHMADYKMFGELDKFYEKDFFDSHKTGYIVSNGVKHNMDVFAIVKTDANEKMFYDPTEYTGQYEYIKSISKFFREPGDKNKIVALSTCKDPGTTERTVLFCSMLD